MQRLLGNDYTLEARYVYTKGVHLYVQDRLNVVPEVTPANYIPTFFTMPSAAQFASLTKTLGTPTTPGSVYGTLPYGTTPKIPYNDLAIYGFQQNLVGFNPVGNSRYNGLALQVTKRYSKNFQYVLAYTWSHNEDDSTATLFSTYFTPRRGQDFQNQAADWASSALDHRQRLTFIKGRLRRTASAPPLVTCVCQTDRYISQGFSRIASRPASDTAVSSRLRCRH